MPLDFVTNPLFQIEGSDLDFKVGFKPTKMKGKKYVINKSTGDYIGIVGDGFKCASHPQFFNGIKQVIQDNRLPHELEDAEVKIKTARNNAFGFLDIILPNVQHEVITNKHRTVINERIIALHGIDGSCSNQVHTGAIDTYCSNGQITGDFSSIVMKNTSGFLYGNFINRVKKARANFELRCQMLQKWADTPLNVDGKTFLSSIIKSEKMVDKMYELAHREIAKRGKNVFALYSAFTNYSSYADDHNGFTLRNTGHDTRAESMWKREQEVAKWINSPQFKQLVAA